MQQPRRPAGFPGFGFGFPDLSSLANGGYTYSSSSFVCSGPNGPNFQATNVARQGPGGVREQQASIRDGRTGHQNMKVSRGLGEKASEAIQ